MGRSTFPFSEYLFSDDHKELIKESLWNLCSCILLSRNEGELPDSVPSSIADFLSEVCKPHDIPHNKSQLYQCIAGAARLLWETTLPPHHLQNCVVSICMLLPAYYHRLDFGHISCTIFICTNLVLLMFGIVASFIAFKPISEASAITILSYNLSG